MSPLYEMGGARRGCVARVKGGVFRVCTVFLCVKTRLKLS